MFCKTVHAIFLFFPKILKAIVSMDSYCTSEAVLCNGAVTNSPRALQLRFFLVLATCHCTWPGASAAIVAWGLRLMEMGKKKWWPHCKASPEASLFFMFTGEVSHLAIPFSWAGCLRLPQGGTPKVGEHSDTQAVTLAIRIYCVKVLYRGDRFMVMAHLWHLG